LKPSKLSKDVAFPSKNLEKKLWKNFQKTGFSRENPRKSVLIERVFRQGT
jgi:hypothetical protein